MTLSAQWMTMGMMLGSGWLMGMMLDTYRVLARRFRLRGWVISLVDLLYWTAAAGLVFALLMWSNWGELRFTVFVAVVLGWTAYHAWFSRTVTQGMQWLLRLLESTIRLLVRVLYLTLWVPLVMLGTLLVRLLVWLLRLLLAVLRLPLWLFAPFGRLLAPVGTRIRDRTKPLWRPVSKAWRYLAERFRKDDDEDE